MNLNLEIPINSVSFGQLGFNITHELYKRQISPSIFCIGQPDLSTFDKASDDYKNWLAAAMNGALKKYKKDYPYFKLWHINGAQNKVSYPSFLLSFMETDSITEFESNILNSYNKIFVTSQFTKRVFEDYGVRSPVVFCPMGFDNIHFNRLENQRVLEDVVVMSIFGKFESRKAHKKVIQAWVKKFGGNPKVRLHTYIQNNFLRPEQQNAVYADIFENQRPPFNLTIFGFQQTNSLMNGHYNATNIVLDLSGGEGISLGSMTCIALGSQGVVLNCSAMKDWLGYVDHIVKINPNSKRPAADGMFFHENSPFNIGNFFDFDTDEFIVGCEEAIKRYEANPKPDEKGFILQKEYSYKTGVDIILNAIFNNDM